MYPKINETLYLHTASGDEEEANVEYRSRIAEADDESFLIEVPMRSDNGRMKKLFIGDELSVFFMSEGGVKNYFSTHVIGFKEDVIRMIRLQKPPEESIMKIQRRSYLRVAAELELAAKTPAGQRFLVRTEDIGGGGTSFWCDPKVNLEVGDMLSCWLLLTMRAGDPEHVDFDGEVVRTKELENGRLLAMIKMNRISDSSRQKIIRFCFERQFDFRNR
ncbi:flagellar brake protein [Paenibacillus sp. CN-4]|uniref:flagellar brake protein n=1 Tax=Paenibacillus nanchangensis TaxID=3348343 RepID=UPI00397B1BC7